MVPVVGCQLEAGFKQPPRDRPAHVADPDKSELVVFLGDWFHEELPFGWCIFDFNFDTVSLLEIGLHSYVSQFYRRLLLPQKRCTSVLTPFFARKPSHPVSVASA